jgi:hypothetical protein
MMIEVFLEYVGSEEWRVSVSQMSSNAIIVILLTSQSKNSIFEGQYI